MSDVAYCTTADVRRELRKAELPGDAAQDPQIVDDKITSRTEYLEKRLSRHWYAPDGLPDAEHVTVSTTPNSRSDEHDLPTHGAEVLGAAEPDYYRRRENSDALLESTSRSERRRRRRADPKQRIRVAGGRPVDLQRPRDESHPVYTSITLERRDVRAVTSLLVVDADGGTTDWVTDPAYDGGVGTEHRGKDWWVQINSGGVSELRLDIHALDDDLSSLSNAVYPSFEYGHEGIPDPVRRAVACWAAADLVEEAVVEIPQNATVYGVETKAEELTATAEELIGVYE